MPGSDSARIDTVPQEIAHDGEGILWDRGIRKEFALCWHDMQP